MSKKGPSDNRELDREIENLHQLLFNAESLENFCVANEIIDINRYKIIQHPAKISKIIKRKLKPFQFVNNKN